LEKEFSGTAEAKKINKTFVFVAVILAAVAIMGAVIGFLTKHESFFAFSPIVFLCIWPAVLTQSKFENWLATEKNIVMKKEANDVKNKN